uniref:DUF3378 domain-containing protein n=1 Tax=Enterococcus faecium TaxID=1352 RepID=UPI00292DB9C3
NKQIPYTSFAAKKDGTTITAYTSGKVMFQGTNAAIEADKWGEVKKKIEIVNAFLPVKNLNVDRVSETISSLERERAEVLVSSMAF